MQRPYESDHLRAKGNLSYLGFIRLVKQLWEDSHPEIPLFALGNKGVATYPVLIYRLDLRKPLDTELKPRYREEIPTHPGEDAVIVAGQRFQNLITFTVFTQTDAHTAEEVIEVFEDFMIEFTPVFKELGLSDIFYSRRAPDVGDMRPGPGVVERSVSYLVVTEKIIKTTVRKLNEITANLRVDNSSWQGAFPIDSAYYYFESNATDGTITALGADFAIGDNVVVSGGTSLPAGLTTGTYTVASIIDTPLGREFALSKYQDITHPINISGSGSGLIRVAPDGLTVNIVDDQGVS